MSSIDDRIVNMEFNNRSFLSGVKDSLSSLDKLKSGLDLKSAGKGLSDLEKTGKAFSLQGIADGVEYVSSKFTAMGLVGITALTNIVNKAVDAGARMVHALSVAPIMDGFREYELKMGSIQTILANTSRHGTVLDDVTSSLDELNDYADKTIYNFGDMTKNIGLFTNAGLKVEAATSMIKGFSNEAAASGTTSQGAAGAAYQLSQALSAGTIRLMDWRSLTNAGMGNKNMQNGLIEIADAMGTLTANSIDAETVQSDFNGSLEKNWLSADVMSNYLQIMAGDMDAAAQSALGLSDAQIKAFAKQQKTAEEAATKVRTWTQLIDTIQEGVGSSWAETFDLILGDFDEATELFTNVNDALSPIIEAMGDARNSVVKAWADAGGRDSAIQALANAFDAVMTAIKPVKEAFTEIFPPITGKQLAAITKAIESFTENLKMGERTAENVKSTFKGFFAVLDIGWEIIKGLARVLSGLFPVASKGAGGILEFTGSVGDFLVGVRDAIKAGDGLTTFFEVLGKVIKTPIDLLVAIGRLIKSAFSGIGDLDFSGFEVLGERFVAAFEPLSKLGSVVTDVWSNVVSVFQKVVKFLAPVGDFFADVFANIGDALKAGIEDMDVDSALGVINTGLLGGAILIVKKFFDRITNMFSGGGVTGIVDSIKDIFGALNDTMKAFQNNIKADTLLKIAGAIALLTISVVALSMIDAGRLTSSLTAITVMFGQLMGAMAIFEKIASSAGFAKMPILAASMGLLAGAILLLSASVVVLSRLDWNELAKGIVGVTALLGAMAGASHLMSGQVKGMMRSATAMILLAVAVKLLASAVEDLSALNWEELAKGLVGVGGLLGSLILFTKFAAANKGAVAQGAGLLLLATAIKILSDAVGKFADMDWGSIGKGLVTLGAVLVGLGVFSKVAAGATGMIGASIGMVILGAALKILASAMKDFASMSWEEIIKGIVGMAGALLVITGAMLLLPPNMIVTAAALVVVGGALMILAEAFKNMASMSWEEIGRGLVVLAGSLLILAGAMALMGIPLVLLGSVGLLAASVALTALAPAMKMLGGMSWDEIGRGLTVLAGALAIMAIGGVLLLVALPGLMGLGVAILLIGTGAMLAGVGLAAMAVGLTALAAAGAAGAVALGAMLTVLVSFIPQIIENIGIGLVAFMEVMAAAGPQMTETFVVILTSIITAIGELTPLIVQTLMDLLVMLLNTLASAIPQMVDAGLRLINGVLQGIASNIEGIVTAALDIIANFLQGIANGLPGIIESGTNIIISFINGMTNSMVRITDAAFKAVITFVNGVADSIRNNSGAMRAAGGNLASAIIEGMTGGLFNGVGRVVEAAKSVASSALEGAKNFLGINSPSKEFQKIGAWSAEGMAGGIDANTGKVYNSSEKMGKTALDSIKDTMSRLDDEFNMNTELTPTITPVLDLTDLKKGAGQISGLMGQPQKLKMDASYEAAKSVNLSSASQQTDSVSQTSGGPSTRVQNITFNQNNTSPKALSDIEIYRQTKNLLSTAKEGINA